MLSKAPDEVPGPFNADRSALRFVVAKVERDQGLASRSDGGHQDGQVLVVGLASERVSVLRTRIVDPTDRRLRQKPEGGKRPWDLALKVPFDHTTDLLGTECVDQPEFAELQYEVAGSSRRRGPGQNDI